MSWRRDLVALDGRFRTLREPGPWIIGVALFGLALRGHFALFTPGTLDVLVWEGHAQEITLRGVLDYYHGGRFTFNHPPWMGLLAAGLWRLAEATSLSFAFLLRAPFALLDAGTALLLGTWLSGARSAGLRHARWVVASLYWLSPLAAVLSAHHGNTDSAVAFFLVLAALLASRDRALLCGVALGASLWIKIPGILAAPLLALAFTDRRARVEFSAAFSLTALAGYMPWLWQDASAVVRAVFLYPGLMIQTTNGTPIWGMQVFYPTPQSLTAPWRGIHHAFASTWLAWNTIICLVPIAAWSWMRRGRRLPEDLAFGITGVYVILYGLSNFWAFQYLAWSLPFWLICGVSFATAANLIATAYVYGLYAWLCDDWLLRGEWRFIGLPDWPTAILLARNACVLFFFGTTLWWLARALAEEIARWRSESGVG